MPKAKAFIAAVMPMISPLVSSVGGSTRGCLRAAEARFLAEHGIAGVFGWVVGPALSGLLSDRSIMPRFSTQTPLLARVALGALNFRLLLFLFREPARATSAQKRTPLSLA